MLGQFVDGRVVKQRSMGLLDLRNQHFGSRCIAIGRHRFVEGRLLTRVGPANDLIAEGLAAAVLENSVPLDTVVSRRTIIGPRNQGIDSSNSRWKSFFTIDEPLLQVNSRKSASC